MPLPPPLIAFFAHPWMLLWALAAAAPLLIHLLNRRRYREQPWAAMEYLLAAMRKNVRRVRIENWLLLALRTLLVVLLVAAVADPVLKGLGLPNIAGVRTHRLFLLDGSYSMDYRADDATRFAHAKQTIADIVDQCPQGDGFTLILMGTPTRVVVQNPAFAKQEFLSELDALQMPHGGADLGGALTKAAEIIEASRKSERKLARDEVYIVSDLGRQTWRKGDRAAAQRCRDQATKLIAEGAELVVMDVGQEDAGNLAVTALATQHRLATCRAETVFAAQIRNFGRERRPRERVQFFVDGVRAAESSVDLPAGGSASATFRFRFDTPGDHAVEVRVGGDRLDVDNHRWLSVSVKERLRVLCVDGRPSSGGPPGAADYLRVALAPDDADEALVETDIATEATWLERDLSAYDCIFLAEVSQFTAAEASALSAYLAGGGGLVTFLGPGVDVANYNERLNGEAKLLPATIGELVTENQQAVDPLGYRHPIVAPFRDQEQSGLLTTPIKQYYRLAPASERGAQVVAGLSGGAPLIVEAPAGRGVSILVATSASDRDWTLLPVWPSFVPLVQEMLIAALQGESDDRNLLIGQPLTGTLRSAAGDANVTIKLPNDSEVTVKAIGEEAVARWSYANTQWSGVYRARWTAPTTGSSLYAVNIETAESDLARLDEAALRSEVWPDVAFQLHSEWRDVDAAQAVTQGRGATMHFGLLVAALGLMFAESTLAWYFGARQA